MKKLLLLLNILLIASCNNQGNETISEKFPISYKVSLDDKNKYDLKIPDIIESVELVALDDTPEEALFKRAHKIIVYDDHIYIKDLFESTIIVFDIKGKFLYSINRRGGGPKEYLNMRSFTVDKDHIYALVYTNTTALHIYDRHTGEFRNDYKLPFSALDLEMLNNGDLIFSCPAPHAAHAYGNAEYMPDEDFRYRLIVTDQETNIKKKLFEYDNTTYKMFFSSPAGLQSSENKLLFGYGDSNLFALIDKNDINNIEYLSVNIGKNQVPKEHLNDIDFVERSHYRYYREHPTLCNDYIYFSTINDKYENYLYRIQDNSVMIDNKESGSFIHTLYSPMCSYKNKFVSHPFGEAIYTILLEEGFPSNTDHEIKQKITNRAPFLIFYTTK